MNVNKQQLEQLHIDIQPGRLIPPKSRALTGQVSLRNGKSVSFESSIERDCLIRLDFDVADREIRTQPFTLSYEFGGKKYRYTPDIIVEFQEQEGIPVTVIEVKPRKELEENWSKYQLSFDVMRELCRRNGWNFHVMTEDHVRTGAYVANATFLRKYLGLPVDPARALVLIKALHQHSEATANELLAMTFPIDSARANAMWILWTLVANKVIGFNMQNPLKMDETKLVIVDPDALSRYEAAVANLMDEVTA